jgi:uncharacterized membrane protein SpoIIM required for sporulation
MSEDLDSKWNEPATRDDLRLLAMRIDSKFDQLRDDFRLHTSGTKTKPDQFFGEFTRMMNYTWVALAYVAIVTCLGTTWIVTTLSR